MRVSRGLRRRIRRRATAGPARALALAAWLWPVGVFAQSPPAGPSLPQPVEAGAPPAAEAAAPASPCGEGSWRLDGASLKAATGASYVDAWTPELERAAGCVRSLPTACLEVRGHFDATAFADEVVRTFGSLEAAQQARAHGRAASVVEKLRELGVPEAQVREAWPLATPTFRGVTVQLRNDCTGAGPQPADLAPIVRGMVQEVVQPELDAQASALDGRMARIEAAQAAPEAPPPRPPHTFWVEAGLGGSLLAVPDEGTSSSVASVLRLGGGWRHRWIYVRADAGGVLGSAAEERLGIEGALAAGYARDLFSVGLRGGLRRTTHRPSDPWLDFGWDLGVEGYGRLFARGPWQVGVTGLLAPLGILERQGEVVDGVALRIPERSSYAFRADLGVVVRFSPASFTIPRRDGGDGR